MKLESIKLHRPFLISLLIVSLGMMPLLGLHIHLPETHSDTAPHTHQSETHGFHIHTSQHDNIDVEEAHRSDTTEINLDLDAQIHKIIKILAFVASLFIFILWQFEKIQPIRIRFIPPCRSLFEPYSAMRRGPPVDKIFL
ncbi:MAG: hypothetical protein OEZ33_02080 [Gammaproteobacteria bacterium]|nr:hypothetical protein [Gammaproteobacteria bacterium]MDH5776974.1 hypothetical protein [Gammaproteobacteria bacterium]